MRHLLAVLPLVLISACATVGPQSKAYLEAPRTIAETQRLSAVPFIKQTTNYCGPATLAMAMQSVGTTASVDQLGHEMITPGMQGTLQEDMLGASRRHGLLAIKVNSIPELLAELAAGHPVIVLQNLGLSWYPRWHYAIAVGYDLQRETITLHSGENSFDETNLRRFERTWALGSHWAIIVLKPGNLPAKNDDLAVTTAAAGLEQVGKTNEAEMSYQKILTKWPDSLGALIGMGNLRYAAKDYPSSVKYLRRASERHPDSAMVWHNLATAQGSARQLRAARHSAARAIALAAPEDQAQYRASLAEWL